MEAEFFNKDSTITHEDWKRFFFYDDPNAHPLLQDGKVIHLLRKRANSSYEIKPKVAKFGCANIEEVHTATLSDSK